MAALTTLETSVYGSLDCGHFGQRVFTTYVKDVSRSLDCITFARFLGPELLLFHLEELLLQLISFLLDESHLVLKQELFVAVVLPQLRDLVLQLSYLLLHGLWSLCPRQHAQLSLVVDIGEALAFSQHVFLSVPQVGPRPLIISALPAQPRCMLLEFLREARRPLLLILDCLTFGSNLRSGSVAH